MKILVCVKRVPAPGAKINVAADGMDVDAAHLGFTTSPHEECAVEGAIQLKELHGGTVTVLTLGGGEAEEQLRYAASVGADHGVLVRTDAAPWDPQRSAAAIADAIRELEVDGPFDLVLFGNESADSGGFQVGIRVAHALSRPIVQGIKGIDVGDDSITARREIDGGFEVYELPTPCALGVKEGLNLPRYPTMKGRLASKKLEIRSIDAEGAPGGQTRVQLHRPIEQISETVILGEGPEAAAAVVDVLEELGVL
jgi:electron transfer flavoprotein beta subunit